MGLWSRLFGLVGGIAAGGAVSKALEPELEGIVQDAWKANPIRVLEAAIIAQAVAQELADQGSANTEGEAQGLDANRMEYMTKVFQTAPGIGEAIELLRREFITAGDFDHARKKQALEPQWTEALQKLVETILSPADIANAIQQGFIPDDGILPGPTGGTHGIHIPVEEVGIDPVTEAKHSGYNRDRLKVLAELVGIPPGPGELMQMLNRGIIDDASYYTGIREGHTKSKWSDALKQLRFFILSPIEAANLRLRGWIDDAEMYRLGSLAGAQESEMHNLFLMQGRPPGPGQLQTAFNRGLIDRARFDKGIEESDVRPEWTDTYFGLRVRYPSIFALRQLGSSGALTITEVADILKLEGIPPDLATKMATAFAAGKVAKQKELALGTIETLYEARYIDQGQATSLLTKLGYRPDEITLILELGDARRVKRFLDTAVGRIHSKFVSHRLPENIAIQELNALNISTQAINDLIAEWKLERDVNVPLLTAAQWAAAVYYAIVPRDEAIQEIKGLGYSDRDAHLLVDIRLHGPPAPGTI